MSEENVQLVRKLLEMFDHRQHEAVFRYYDPEIEWIASSSPFQQEEAGFDDLAGDYHGHDGVRAYWRTWLQAWSDLEFEVEDVLDGGDDVVALIRNQRMWGRHSGITVEMPPFGLVFTIRDGRVVRWQSFTDQRSALEAAGIKQDSGT